MGNIDDFKANLLGGGARANQFRITITPPPGIAIGLDVRRTSFLVTAAAIPAITGTSNPADYQADLIVEQLDRDDTILKTYLLRNCFPTTIGEIALSNENQDAIETFDVTWKYQHVEASGVNF